MELRKTITKRIIGPHIIINKNNAYIFFIVAIYGKCKFEILLLIENTIYIQI